MVAFAVIVFISHLRRTASFVRIHRVPAPSSFSILSISDIIPQLLYFVLCEFSKVFVFATAMPLQSVSMQHQVLFVNWKEILSSLSVLFFFSSLYLSFNRLSLSFPRSHCLRLANRIFHLLRNEALKTYGKLFGNSVA